MADEKLQEEAVSETKSFTVREMISRLALCEDMDSEVNMSVFNSDPIPVADIEEDTESNIVTLSN